MKIFPASSWVLTSLVLASLCAGLAIAQSSDAASGSAPKPDASAAGLQTQSPSTPSTNGAERTSTPTLTIRQTVRRVILDVMVRDTEGKPVHGLTEGDFTVAEDKAPQRILSFDVYDFEKPSISRSPNARPLPPNFFENIPALPERGPLYVILDDMVNTEIEDQMVSRQQILKFINSKPAGTRFAVFVASDRLTLVQGFTDNKDLLFAALDPNHPKPHVPKVFLYGPNYGKGDPYTSLDMLTHIGQYLDGIPGRKNLIWVSGRFDIALFPRAEDPVDLQNEIRTEINALAQAQVAVFPLNARGVILNPEGALTGARPNGGAQNVASTAASGIAPAQSMSSSAVSSNPVAQVMQAAGQGDSVYNDQMTEDAVAMATGGRAFYSTNDISGALDEATEDGGNYYTLTYSPPNQEDDNKCHNIVVSVAKAKYQLSYRRYYCRVPVVSTTTDESEETGGRLSLAIPLQAGDVLQANMRPGAPMVHDLIFSAHVRADGAAAMATPEQMAQLEEQAAFFRTNRRKKAAKPVAPIKIQSYVVDYRVLDPQLVRESRGGKPATLEFAVAAFDAEGKVQNGVVNDAEPDTLTQSAANKAGLYLVRQTLVVPVNATSIRVGVRDRSSDRMGTIEVKLPLAPEPVAKAAKPTH